MGLDGERAGTWVPALSVFSAKEICGGSSVAAVFYSSSRRWSSRGRSTGPVTGPAVSRRSSRTSSAGLASGAMVSASVIRNSATEGFLPSGVGLLCPFTVSAVPAVSLESRYARGSVIAAGGAQRGRPRAPGRDPDG
ncbi:hypothetical protein ARUE_232p00930 (plasmid) [Arthrobacter sp. Rue61a]|nr:hypothetical protein ARUE_232p00930 [Arthrobacter sp. Rue61a]